MVSVGKTKIRLVKGQSLPPYSKDQVGEGTNLVSLGTTKIRLVKGLIWSP